jgi:anti-sigma B factor antagonist
MLSLNTRTVREVTVVAIGGRLSAGDAVTQLRAVLTPILDGGNGRLVLDLSDLRYMDSSGIEELIGTFQTLRSRNGGLRLLKPNSKVKELLDLTKLSDVLGVVDDEDAAISGLLADAEAEG